LYEAVCLRNHTEATSDRTSDRTSGAMLHFTHAAVKVLLCVADWTVAEGAEVHLAGILKVAPAPARLAPSA